MTVVMLYGLFMFIFRIRSRRDFNANLTLASLNETLKKLLEELKTIPHADTLSRLLDRIDVDELEKIHVQFIKDLIKKKKFTKLLISGCLPIAVDGTQKTKRDGDLESGGWLLRTIKTKTGDKLQQYLLVVEANITLANGLTIPLLSEYCKLAPADIKDEVLKQDCELKAFERLVNKLKKYFPRQRLILLLDNLYACESVIAQLMKNNWEFMIKLPSKLSSLYSLLQAKEDSKVSIPGQTRYNSREQYFYWLNDCNYRGMVVHLVACEDNWDEVSNENGNRIRKRSLHTWISSVALSLENVHELCNLGGRNRALIEDSFNTEKNRGYYYKHLFSHNWHAMRGFHLLMRLAHAINALSTFGKLLRKFIRTLGIHNTFTIIYESIKHCWLSDECIQNVKNLSAQLRLDL